MSTATKAPSLPKRITDKHVVRFCGGDYTVAPAVAKGHLGDGRHLLKFQPLNTRPDYYLIRIDSSWEVADTDDLDMIDEEIIDALIEEFGEMEREREYLKEDLRAAGVVPSADNTDLSGNESRLGFPVLSLDSGYGWALVAKFDGRKWVEL